MKNLLFIASIILFFTSCKKEGVPPSNFVKHTATTNPKVGDSYEGGVVAYVLQPGDAGYDSLRRHGLIAAPYDLNTCSWDFAASSCADFEYAGYTDWYLPNQQELERLFTSRIKTGGFTNYYYWSSNECNSNKAWILDFGTAYHLQQNKTQLCKARPVRCF